MPAQVTEASQGMPPATLAREPNWLAAPVFVEWCLRREAPQWRPSVYRMTLLIPIALAGLEAATIWPNLRHPGMGREAVRQLLLDRKSTRLNSSHG